MSANLVTDRMTKSTLATSASKTRLPRFFSGIGLLFISATLVNGGNYLFNLLLGRWLGPAAFADLSLIVTLFLVTSFLTAGLQTPVAKFVARYTAEQDQQGVADVRRWSIRLALQVGGLLLLLFALGAPLWTQIFATTSALPFVIFGLLVPFYLVQGVERGRLQGAMCFGWLAFSYQAEMWTRLLVSVLLVALGWGVNGAVLGIGISFIATWFVARYRGHGLPLARPLGLSQQRALLAFIGPVLAGQLGQILVNNSDILIVRRFFPAEAAGHYAALALTGRIVFFATWSIVTASFPIVAQRHHRGEGHRHLLWGALGVVTLGSLLITGLLLLWPESIVQLLFGPAYLAMAPLLWLYALATMAYALANVVINYRLSLGSTGGTYLSIGAGLVQIGLLWRYHATLEQVVWVQLWLMAALFLLLLAWESVSSLRKRT